MNLKEPPDLIPDRRIRTVLDRGQHLIEDLPSLVRGEQVQRHVTEPGATLDLHDGQVGRLFGGHRNRHPTFLRELRTPTLATDRVDPDLGTAIEHPHGALAPIGARQELAAPMYERRMIQLDQILAGKMKRGHMAFGFYPMQGFEPEAPILATDGTPNPFRLSEPVETRKRARE